MQHHLFILNLYNTKSHKTILNPMGFNFENLTNLLFNEKTKSKTPKNNWKYLDFPKLYHHFNRGVGAVG